MMTTLKDRYDRWFKNHEQYKAARDGVPADHRGLFNYLLILELQGELSSQKFAACLATAAKTLNEDIARAKARIDAKRGEEKQS